MLTQGFFDVDGLRGTHVQIFFRWDPLFRYSGLVYNQRKLNSKERLMLGFQQTFLCGKTAVPLFWLLRAAAFLAPST